MYGRIFESLYEGSMVGAGSPTFAVWTYVIAKMKPDKEVGAQVELNPELVGFILGEKMEVIEKVIMRLCRPDPNSTTPDKEGRRLIRLGQFSYQVVNGARYMAIRNQEEKRRSNREYKRRERAKRNGKPLPGEVAAVRAMENGDSDAADAIVEASLKTVGDGK